MAKSQLERQLERMQKDSKKHASENNKRAIQQAIRDRASSIVNGQPIINGLRIMDETAEILLQCLLDLQKESGNDTFTFVYEKLPECVIAAIGLEFEKLTQYGMTAPALLWMGAGSVSILPPAKSYFDKKAESIDMKKHITKDGDNNAPSNVEKLLTIYTGLNMPNSKAYFGTLYNKDGEGRTWNGAVKKHMAYPEMFLIGKKFWEKILPDGVSFEEFVEIYKEALEEIDLNARVHAMINSCSES